jgi:hypothetical protein
VNENKPLSLELKLKGAGLKSSSREAVAIMMILALIGLFYLGFRKKQI